MRCASFARARSGEFEAEPGGTAWPQITLPMAYRAIADPLPFFRSP
jgi:hypothetical protein